MRLLHHHCAFGLRLALEEGFSGSHISKESLASNSRAQSEGVGFVVPRRADEGALEVSVSSSPSLAMCRQHAQGLWLLLPACGCPGPWTGHVTHCQWGSGGDQGADSVRVGFDVHLFDSGRVTSLSLSLLICEMG